MIPNSSFEPLKNKGSRNGDWHRDEFLAMLSHEIRNSTQIIASWAELLCMHRVSVETLTQGLEIIRRNGQLQARLIKQLLALSQKQSDGLCFDDRRITLVPILEAATKAMMPQALAKAIKLHAELEPSADSIIGDPAQMEEVFTNLLSNAIKFTPAGGQIEIRFGCQQGCAQITVSDTGRGISAEFLPHVFDRFRREKRNQTEPDGLGLGLAIAQYLIERHQGKIYAFSAGEGKGTTFKVCLPLEPNAVVGAFPSGIWTTSASDCV
jgi:two-component system CheB/CheR fusion protein